MITNGTEFITNSRRFEAYIRVLFFLIPRSRRRMAKSDDTDIVVRLGSLRGARAEIVGLVFIGRRRSVETCRKSRSPAACGCHPDSRLNERFVPGRQKNAILILEIPESVRPQHMSPSEKTMTLVGSAETTVSFTSTKSNC